MRAGATSGREAELDSPTLRDGLTKLVIETEDKGRSMPIPFRLGPINGRPAPFPTSLASVHQVCLARSIVTTVYLL